MTNRTDNRTARKGAYRMPGPVSRLRAARLARNLTLAELAAIVGTSEPALSDLERGVRLTGQRSIGGQPTLRARLAEALGRSEDSIWPPEEATG